MFERFTDRARKAMALANQEAQRLCHEYIDTEHILIGLIKEGEGEAAEFLKQRGYNLNLVRQEVEKAVGCGPDMITMGKPPQSPRAKQVIEFSLESARDKGAAWVDTIDILWGVAKVKEGVAYKILTQLGFEDDDLEDYLESGVMSVGFWHVPRKSLDLAGFLDLCGYEMQTGKIDHKKSSRVVGVFPANYSAVAPLEVHYALGNMEQTKEALRFKELLDKNHLRYKEVPTSLEVLSQLKEPIEWVYSIARRLEKKVEEE